MARNSLQQVTARSSWTKTAFSFEIAYTIHRLCTRDNETLQRRTSKVLSSMSQFSRNVSMKRASIKAVRNTNQKFEFLKPKDKIQKLLAGFWCSALTQIIKWLTSLEKKQIINNIWWSSKLLKSGKALFVPSSPTEKWPEVEGWHQNKRD